MHEIGGPIDIAHDHAFGNFELYLLTADPKLLQRFTKLANQVSLVKLASRQVDAHSQGKVGELLLPYPQLSAGSSEDPLPQVDDQAGFLGYLDKLPWRDKALLGPIPAD